MKLLVIALNLILTGLVILMLFQESIHGPEELLMVALFAATPILSLIYIWNLHEKPSLYFKRSLLGLFLERIKMEQEAKIEEIQNRKKPQ